MNESQAESQVGSQAESQTNGDDRQPNRWWADSNLVAVAVIWGINMPIMKFALGRTDPYLFNAMRLTCSAIALGTCVTVLARLKSRKSRGDSSGSNKGRPEKRPGYSRSQWLNILWFSFLAGFLYQVCFLLGINATTAGNTAIIMSAVPVWTAILAFMWLRERLSSRGWAGLLIAFVGVLVVTFGKPTIVEGSAAAVSSLKGNLIVSLGAFTWAFASVWSRPLMKSVAPLNLAFFSIVLTVPFHYLIAGSALSGLAACFQDPWLIAAIVYSGTFSTGLAYAMWNYGIHQLGASHAAGFQNLVPLVALVASWALIGEVPFPLQLVGGCLIIAGLLNMRWNRKNIS